MSSTGVLTSVRLSRNDGTGARTLRRNATARAASDVFRAADARSRAWNCSSTNGGPATREFLESSNRLLQRSHVALLGSKTGPLEQNREIVGPQPQQLVELLLGKRVGVLDTRSFDLLGQRKTRPQVLRVELDRPTEMRDSLVQPASRHFQATLQELDLAVVGRKLRGARRQTSSRCRTHRAGPARDSNWPRLQVLHATSSAARPNSCLALSSSPTSR